MGRRTEDGGQTTCRILLLSHRFRRFLAGNWEPTTGNWLLEPAADNRRLTAEDGGQRPDDGGRTAYRLPVFEPRTTRTTQRGLRPQPKRSEPRRARRTQGGLAALGSPCPPWFTEFAQEDKILTSGSANRTRPEAVDWGPQAFDPNRKS